MVEEQVQSETESLEDLFVRFAQAILVLMEACAKSEGISQDEQRRIYFGSNFWHEQQEKRDNYGELLMRHFDEHIWTIDEAERCAKSHWAAGIPQFLHMPNFLSQGGTAPTYQEAQPHVVYQLLRPVLDVLERYQTFQPSREQLLEAYQRFAEGWTAPDIRFDITAPLLNFTSHLYNEPIPGTQFQFHISTFTPEEKNVLWNRQASSLHFQALSLEERPLDINQFSRVQSRLTGTRSHVKGKPYDLHDVTDEVADIITALRLVKAGDVGAFAIFERASKTSSVDEFSTASLLSDQHIRPAGAKYTLENEEVPVFQELFGALRRLAQQAHRGGLSVALRRFNQAYSRDNGEDRVIDLTIALEGCLLAGTEDELQYKLSLRGAALLARVRKPREVASLLKTMYEIRSKIVHEGKMLSELEKDMHKKLSGMNPNDFPQHCEDIVRQILSEYVARLADEQYLKTLENMFPNEKSPIKRLNADLESQIVESLAPQFDESSQEGAPS